MHFALLQQTFLVITTLLSITHSWQVQPAQTRHSSSKSVQLRPPSTIKLPQPSTIVKAVTMTDGSSKEAWTKPRLHNKGAFRSIALLGALAAAGLSSNSPLKLLSAQGMAALHLFSYSTWFGTMMYTTFILGITMFKNLPRKTFGTLQAKIFPKYFALSSAAIILQIVTLQGLTSNAASATLVKSTKSLVVALVMTLLNQYVIEPITTNNMMRRYELEETQNGTASEEYRQLKSKFGKFHGISSLTNLIALCAAAVHGFYLSAALI